MLHQMDTIIEISSVFGGIYHNFQTWQNMQNLLGKFGSRSVKNRISRFKPRDLDGEVIRSAWHYLDKLKFEDVQDVSLGASTFFAWVSYFTTVRLLYYARTVSILVQCND